MSPKDVSIILVFFYSDVGAYVDHQVAKHEEGFRNGQSAEELWGTEVASAVQRRRREAEEWIKAIY
jgi:hypothetical protein